LGTSGEDLPLAERRLHFGPFCDRTTDRLAANIVDVPGTVPAILVWLGQIPSFRHRLRLPIQHFVPHLLELCWK
jgi:hypothetical protein